MPNLGALRDRLELILSIPSGDSYVDSTAQLQDIQDSYYKTSYTWDWPQLLVKRGARILSNQRKYPLPTNFRKFRYLYVLGVKYNEVEPHLIATTPRSYAVDWSTEEFIISTLPSASGTEFTTTNAESAGQTVTIELNSVTGLAAGDEIVFPDDGNPEVTYVASVDAAAVTITARLDTSKSASAVMYKGVDNIMFAFYRTVTDLSISTDTPLLPTPVHFPMLSYAAYLAYQRLEQYTEADKQLQYWNEQMVDYWRAFDKGSTGAVTTFSV